MVYVDRSRLYFCIKHRNISYAILYKINFHNTAIYEIKAEFASYLSSIVRQYVLDYNKHTGKMVTNLTSLKPLFNYWNIFDTISNKETIKK